MSIEQIISSNARRAGIGLTALTFAALSATGCAQTAPRNAAFMPRAELEAVSHVERPGIDHARALNRQRCAGPLLARSEDLPPAEEAAPTRFSAGDVLDVTVSDGEDFSGTVEIGRDGLIDLPHLAPLPAAHASREELQDAIAHRLVATGYFRAGFAIVSVELMETGPRRVEVSGAVFQPGTFIVNDRAPDAVRRLESDSSGDSASGASVADALRRAAGIRPDADIANIVLVRNGERRVLDMTGAFTGTRLENPDVMAGDTIIVPGRGCFQEDLARVSAVTAPGIRLFMSNLTRPAASNAASAIGRDAVNLPYGSRLMQAAVSANCVGGTYATNAHRHVVLMTRDWETGRTIVVERAIEDLVRRADRDDFNPFLQEGDAIACYDSRVTNARDLLGIIGETVTPALLMRDFGSR